VAAPSITRQTVNACGVYGKAVAHVPTNPCVVGILEDQANEGVTPFRGNRRLLPVILSFCALKGESLSAQNLVTARPLTGAKRQREATE